MKNKILAIIRDTIPYCKDLRPIAGSVTACILMQQLDYWFAKKPEGFYKFKAPCPHPLYKEGDSWKEELGFSEDEIQTAFAKIGVAYKSKTAMAETFSPFKDDSGKELFYCSFYDRESRLTWYQRNHKYADTQLDKLVSYQKPTIPDSEKPTIPDYRNRQSPILRKGESPIPLLTENTLTKTTTDQIKNLEKSKIFSEKISLDAALAAPSASSSMEKRFKLKGKTLAQIAEDLLEFYTQHDNYWKELVSELKVNGYLIEKGTEQQQFKKSMDFFKSWATYWHNKSKPPKYPTEVDLHNMIFSDIGKMMKLKLLEVAAADPAATTPNALEAALLAGAIKTKRR